MCMYVYVFTYVYTHIYLFSIHIDIFLTYIYIAFIYLSRQVCSFMPQRSNPSTLNQVKGRGEEYVTYGEHEALVRGKPSKLKLGSVFSFEMQSPTTFIPRGKNEKWEVYEAEGSPKRHKPTTLATTDRH